jgi:hypothetical protein
VAHISLFFYIVFCQHTPGDLPSQAEVVSDELKRLTLRFLIYKAVTVVVMLATWLLFFFWLFPKLGRWRNRFFFFFFSFP